MSWHYQPVYETEDDGTRCYSLCEVYLDGDGKLKGWTQNPSMKPQGTTVEELVRDLGRMLAATSEWEPVEFSELKVGTTLHQTGITR